LRLLLLFTGWLILNPMSEQTNNNTNNFVSCGGCRARNYSVKLPDGQRPGDGRCSACAGYTEARKLECKRCGGTGICPGCQGSGIIKY
jgi:hypothetical protein